MLKSIETKMPPPMLAAFFVIGMWLVSQYLPRSVLDETVRLSVAIGLASFGALFSILGVVSLVKAKTTVNPLQPEKAGTLVTTGIYQYTRNPMYWVCYVCYWLGACFWPTAFRWYWLYYLYRY